MLGDMMSNLIDRLMPIPLRISYRSPDDDEVDGVLCTCRFWDYSVISLKVLLPHAQTNSYITYIAGSYYVSLGGDELFKCEKNG